MSGRIGYLVPEFPGQTHTWIWRELLWLRRWGADVRLISTRPPPERDRARHAFAAAAAETFYLYRSTAAELGALLGAVARRSATHPRAVANATRLASSLPVDASVGRRRCLALLAPAARLAGLCEQEGITHVHCHTCGDGAIVAMLAQAMGGVPYSITINANLDWWGGALEEKLGRAAFTVSTMRWVQKDVQARFARAIADRCHYAPVGVDTDAWRPEPRRMCSPGEPLRLLCVGRLHRSKGFDVALHALRQVLDGGRAARLTILGSGPEAQALAALAAGLGLGTQVDLAGSMPEDEVRRALADADIFLLPSHAEPLGVVVMEAMAMAVPVIVTRAGGVAEIVTDGVDGLMVPPGDPEGLAQAILALGGDPERATALGAAGRRSVVQRFDARVGAQKLLALLSGRPPIELAA